MFRNIDASLRTIDEITLSEAAASLGASFLQRMRRVIIPNIMPGILSGSLLVFAISFGEFEVTSMVAGFKTRTLPLVLFQQLRDDFRAASAMAAFLVYISLSALLVITTLQRKIE
jgi:putative spermidine/putrescine transport system permease protein